MKKILKHLLSALLVIVAVLPAVFFVTNMVRIKLRMQYLREADHVAILDACRHAIQHRSEYRNDKDQWGTPHEDDVLVLAPLPPDIPQALRELDPHNLIICERQIIVNMGLPFCRIGLIAFPNGQEQYGTFKYVDGLWFWNGNFESKEMRDRVYRRSGETNAANQRLKAIGAPLSGSPGPQP